MADVLEDDADTPSILLPCVSCNRTFRPEALAKHSKVCEKTLMKKRKKFDSSKQRIQGTDLAEFLPILPTFTKKTDKSPVRKIQAHPSTSQLHSNSKTSLSSPRQENTKWREKHNELVQTIKAARMPPGQAPVIKPSDQETCPYCERSFGPKAYDRHLEWCKEKNTRIQPKSPASQRAKQRLEARTKYRAPPVGKAKRSASRDKIQPESSPQVIHTPVTTRKTYNKPTIALESNSSPNINQNLMRGSVRSSTRANNVSRSTLSSREFQCEETTVYDVIGCNIEQNLCYSKCFETTTIERDSEGRSKILEQRESILEKSIVKHYSKLKRETTKEDLSLFYRSSSSSSKKGDFGKVYETDENYKIRFQSDVKQLKSNRFACFPNLDKKKIRSSISEMTSLDEDNEKHKCNTNNGRHSQSLNSFLHYGSCRPSKLPVLVKKSAQPDQKYKKTHWSEKYEKSNINESYDEFKGNMYPQKRQSKCGSHTYRGLSNFQSSQLKPEEEFMCFKRHKILSPITSESVDSNDKKSNSSGVYEVSDPHIAQTSSKQFSKDDILINSCQEVFEKISNNLCKRSRSDTVTLSSCKEKVQQSKIEVDDLSCCLIPPAEPRGEGRFSRKQNSWRKERMRFPNAVKKVVTQISKKRAGHGLEPYDPYKSAEQQMLELMEPPSQKLAPIVKPPSLVSSPTSAFTKFTSSLTPEPLFISENDNLKVEIKSHASSEKSDSPLTITSPLDNYAKDSNQNSITLSTLSLCSTISIESVDSNKNGYRVGHSNSARVPEKKTPVPLRRTVSAVEPRKGTESRRGRDPLKGILKMEDMLYGSNTVVEGERYFGSPLITGHTEKDDDHCSSGSLYKAVSDAETLNAEQELLKSMSEFEKIFSSSSSSPSPSSPPVKLFPSLVSSFPTDPLDRNEVDFHSVSHTGGPDSAYSSLNRKSPVGGEQEKEPEVARFCHECGAKYPVLVAKFCCQCGVRRLVI